MIDIAIEKPITLAEAACLLPKPNGKRISTSTLWRWSRKGINGVKLEYIRVGGRIFTSAQAVTRFVNQLAEADEAPGGKRPDEIPIQNSRQTARDRRRAELAHRADEEILRRAGI